MTVPTVDARNENVAVLLDWARNELANARSRLEAPNMSHDEAQLLRGKIAVLKEFVEGCEPSTRESRRFELDREAFHGNGFQPDSGNNPR